MVSTQKPIRVLVVDAYPIVRWALRRVLSEAGTGIGVVGEAASEHEAVSVMAEARPDVVVMGVPESGVTDGNQPARVSEEHKPVVRIFEKRDCADVGPFLDSGGKGCVLADNAPDELVPAVKAAAANMRWVSPELRSLTKTGGPESKWDALSRREREIVALVARGLTTRQIAERLSITPKTVDTHRLHVYRKLQVHNRAQLVDYVISKRLLSLM